MKRVINTNEIEVKKKTKGPCLDEQPVATASKFLPEAELVVIQTPKLMEI